MKRFKVSNDKESLSNIINKLISNENYLLAKEYCQEIFYQDGIMYLIDVLNSYLNHNNPLFDWMIFMNANYDVFINYVFIFPDSNDIIAQIIDIMRDTIKSGNFSEKDFNMINKFILSIPHKFLSNTVCRDILDINNNYFSYLNENIDVTNEVTAWYCINILCSDINQCDSVIADIYKCQNYKYRADDIILCIYNYCCDIQCGPKLLEKLFCNFKFAQCVKSNKLIV